MNVNLAYRGRSNVRSTLAGLAVSLAPNLRRDRVAFEGVLRDPIRFREAIGALHNVVVSDLRFKPRDQQAFEAYKAEQNRHENDLRARVTKQARASLVESLPELPKPYSAALEKQYKRHCTAYWKKRDEYSKYLSKHDPRLWRLLVPCDPVITVAPDCLFFECFSADESSYGCLTVDRSAFDHEQNVALGTTNVDYSWTLYEHFQSIRSYRETRFLIDPAGFEVQSGVGEGYREEKIELPPTWLRGFLQLQAAMSLPMRKLPISREAIYNILAYLKRHRAARSPRAVQFELEPRKPSWCVLEPWGQRIPVGDKPYCGPRSEVIRIWGRDRLHLLARLLPLMDSAEVYLLGTGLPSFWVIRMGPLRLTLGLSGWTANDWTSTMALDQLAPPADPDPITMTKIARAFQSNPALPFDRLRTVTGSESPALAIGLNRLATLGQVIHDLPGGLYRWRQIMPVTLSAELIGPDHPESTAARRLVAEKTVRVSRDETRPDGLRLLEGRVTTTEVSLLLDADGRMLRGRCSCSYHFNGGLRRGPCRHLQALRDKANAAGPNRSTPSAWYESLWN